MKIATKRFLSGILAALCAVCIGAFVGFSLNSAKTVNADQTVKDVTFTSFNSTWNNYDYTQGGYTKYSLLQFTGGINSGHHGQGMDMSDLTANTTYTGSNNTWNFIASSLVFGPNTANNNCILFRTTVEPKTGDTVTIKAGAWFITGGDADEKYVITDEIRFRFNGTTWVKLTPFTFTGKVTWNGATYIACYGFEANSFVNTGAFALLETTSALTDDYTTNLAESDTGNGILFNGTPLSEISGSAIGVYAGQLIVYVHGNLSGVVQICEGTVIGNKYVSEDYYFVVVNKVWGQAMTAANDVSFSTSGTGLTWNGSNGSGAGLGGIASGVPSSGTCSLINVTGTPLGSSDTVQANLKYAPTGKTILCDGTPLYEIDGAVIGVFVGYLFIYIPGEDCIITIQEGTVIGKSDYKVDKDYTYHFKKGANQSSLCWLVDFDSNGGTAVESVYVHNGATVSEPTAPTKANVGDTAYTFAHWEDEGGDEFSFSTAITANTTLTATWTEVVVEEKTFGGFNASENNLEKGYGAYYATRLCFTTGVNSGGATGADFSDLIAKSTYSGSSNTFGYAQGCIRWPAGNKSDAVFNFIYLWTASAPQTNDTLTITAGAWFKTGGDGNNDKYVISDDISITFNGTAWQLATSFNVYDSINGSVAGTYYNLKDGDNFVYTMPTNLSYGGYKVFGFAITDNAVEYFYPAGGTHTSTESNLDVIAIIGTFDMASGAAIRITTAEASGIRWTANVDEISKGHILYWGKAGTTYGTEISADGFSSNFDIKTNLWASDTTYNAVLTDINSDYYTTEFTAKAYVDIAYSDGATTRIYANDTGITRSIRTVAIAALEDVDAEYTARQIEILTAIAG